ncbi:chromosome partitioning protein ParB [Lamprobacter modestohalophilus]|uniref:Probable chromosome-partitioning protein ParB n=1 Tax=Lamprobacter modestohalophilus TaxID=1064514 RepID=A0A9X1B5I7_9GAMM|nr:ParB/RepB/Spo0J family partition protein [Lamprobacter modestohalophilus]MBK1619906.1 chromosome partitioning protein ParB [Lamprobacter modestohalophilus]
MTVAKKKGLGRGLDALLGGARESALPESLPESDAELTPVMAEALIAPVVGEAVRELPLDQIQRGRYQPRRDFDEERLRELADSIAAQGVIQPIVVRSVEPGRYEIVAGERRWRASQQAGLERIPVVVRDVTEQAALAIALIENIQRDDLHPLEEAGALRRLLDEFGLSHLQVAEAVGKSRSTVTNLLRLLELEDEVKTLLDDRRLEMGHARALLGLRGEQQIKAARQVVMQGLSVRDTERLIRRLQTDADDPPVSHTEPAPDPNIRQLQDALAERLGARVAIKHGSKGTGRLVINYNSLDELDGILAHIR